MGARANGVDNGMGLNLRPATAADIEICGQLVYVAFKELADRYGFPPDFPTPEFATQFVGALINQPAVFGVVAQTEAQIVGVNFLDERGPIRAVGPIAVSPQAQGQGIGRQLMQAVLDRGRQALGIRLTQDPFNVTTLSLYASLGFEVQEFVVVLAGRPKSPASAAIEVRPGKPEDLQACASLCQRVYGVERTGELQEALASQVPPGYFAPLVALRAGRITAYTTALDVLGHTVAETEADLKALVLSAGASAASPACFTVPTRQASFLRWCLAQGLRVVKPMTVMALGAYRAPQGFYLPSVYY